ncbi:MAG: HNH endonuclease [Oxalobacteraceae bacterium]|nr:MAG: HNH endonuclease [Oxalobacteraceae bacterium]
MVRLSKKGGAILRLRQDTGDAAVFSEQELARYYHTAERLLENEEIRKFVSWVRKKDPEYFDRNRTPSRRR